METETRVHPLRVNGQPTTQEEIRAHADAILDAGLKTTSVVCGMAEVILALLDLLEASQDFIDNWLTPKALNASLKRGLAQSAAGETVDLGDFSQYLVAGASAS